MSDGHIDSISPLECMIETEIAVQIYSIFNNNLNKVLCVCAG